MDSNRFYSLDVETANNDPGSICQVGIGYFEDGVLADTWKSYIDPEGPFLYYNMRVHGITPDMVANAPKFYEVYAFIRENFQDSIVVHHMPFDRIAFQRVYNRYQLEPYPVHWLDSARVARMTWKQFSKQGYGLKNLAEYLSITFNHHDALEDSVTAGKIVLEASRQKQVGISYWLQPKPSPVP
jgi:DNA polymerase-3 subunit epsilon